MSKINASDLLDFEDVERKLAKLEERFLAFGRSTIDITDRNVKARNEEIASIERLRAALQNVNPKGSSSGSVISTLSRDIDKSIAAIEKYNATLAKMSDVENLNKVSISELKAGVSALKTQYDNLDPSARDFTEEQKKIAAQVKAATQAINAQSTTLKEAIKSVNDVNNTYAKLSRETGELKAQLRSMPGAFDLTTGAINKNNAAAVQLQKQIIQNDAALKKADASMGNFQRNVGNYSSALEGIGDSFKDLIGSIIGIATAFEAIEKGIAIIDEMDRLKIGLDTVSDSSRQTAIRIKFLSSIADQTGVSISDLASSYIDFAAATKNTALEGVKADKIFASFTKTFSALGKDSETAERGLSALQQMISKGKVSSEELNQQLAEALPGANKLFAESLGVSVRELGNLLQKGKVLAEDVLPKVADQLEKTYGDSAQKNIETISGSFTRIINQTKTLLTTLNESTGVSTFFASLNNGIADYLKGLNRAIERQGFFKSLLTGTSTDNAKEVENQRKVDEFTTQSLEKRIARIQLEQDYLKMLSDRLSSMDKNIDGFDYKKTNQDIERQQSLIKELIKLNSDLRRTERSGNEKAKLNLNIDNEKDTKKKLTQYEKLVESAEKLRDIIVDDLLGDARAGRALEPSDDALKKWNRLYAIIERVATAAGDQVPANLRELNDKLNKNPENIANQIQIETLSQPSAEKASDPNNGFQDLAKYNAILGTQEGETDLLNRDLDTGRYKKFSQEYADIIRDQLKVVQDLEKEAALAQTDQERQAVNERLGLAKQEFDEKIRLAREEVAIKKELQMQLVDLAGEIGQAVFQIGSDQRQADLDANQAAMQHELELVGDNQAAQERIRRDYAKKDLEIRQKQAKAEKTQAIFSIALNTIKAVAAANAVGPPANIAFMAIAAALGAVQLAAAIAKPLPQFFKGTKNAPEGFAQIAEQGAEIRESGGRMMLYDKPGIAYLKRGDKVYTARETKQLLERAKNSQEIDGIISRSMAGDRSREEIRTAQMLINAGRRGESVDYDKMTESFVKAIESRPIVQSIVDEKGFRKRVVSKNGSQTYLDKRFSLK